MCQLRKLRSKPPHWRLRSLSSKNEFDAICLFVAAGAMAPDYLDKPVKYRWSFVFQRLSQVVFN
jgi:hypothetical protein